MKAVKRINLRDIKTLEEDQGINILDIYRNFSLDNLLILVRLGNSMCSEEQAGKILRDYFRSGFTVEDVYEEITNLFFGHQDRELAEEDTLNLDNFDSFTSLLDTYCMQLWSLGVDYNTFWSFSTHDLYNVFNSIQIKRQNEINQQLLLSHLAAAQMTQALAGKLPRKPMQINIVDPLDTEAGRAKRDIKLRNQFEALYSAFKAKEIKEGKHNG